jgi:hypothetical protein
MPKKRNPLTLEEHKQLAENWREAHAALDKMFKLMNGRVNKPLVTRLTMYAGVGKHMQALRSDLENLMFKEVGKHGGAEVSVYYPGPDRAP